MNFIHHKILTIYLLTVFLLISIAVGFNTDRYSPFSSYFNNPYDYVDAEAYGANLFGKLIAHMNSVKREKDKCANIPFPKTVLKHKYFNPKEEFKSYKFWFPPKEHQYVLFWSQTESFRNSMFLSYMLQGDNTQFPPGWLYLYLSAAAQLHSLQSIGFNSHKIVKGIKLPFESNEVFKVNWWNNGQFQKFEKPFAIYATQPRLAQKNLVKIIDFGVGNYSNDYTGHAFLGTYLYDRKQFLLNNTYEYSNFYKRPYQGFKSMNEQMMPQKKKRRRRKRYNEPYMQQQSNQQNSLQPKKNLISDLSNPSNRPRPNQQVLQQQQEAQQKSYLPPSLKNKITSISEISPYVYINKQRIPISDWDPLIDTARNNLNRVPDRKSPMGFDQWYIESIVKNTALDVMEASHTNPFAYNHIDYIESYRYAKVWWKNESEWGENKNSYVYRIKPEERYYKFTAAKHEEESTWSTPYFWCPDPTNWLVASMSPIWATNDKEYKNKMFTSNAELRFVGLSEVILNYEEVDINQCPGDRKLNVFASTALCDSTTKCKSRALYGLSQGGYECDCAAGFHYPTNFRGPYRGVELVNSNVFTYPLCLKSERLLQYPNWLSRNENEFLLPSKSTSILQSYNIISKRSVNPPGNKHIRQKRVRMRRFLEYDRRNNFEKLRDIVYDDQDYLRRKCLSMPFQDIVLLKEDDERFILNLRSHANEVFKAQTSQAVRIAHVLSAYLQLSSPFSSSSINSQNSFGTYINLGGKLRPDPELEENIVVGEIMSTLFAHYPLQEVNVFFNGSEFARQKQYASQKNLAFGISMIRSDVEVFLNRSNDHSHLTKSWYQDAAKRFRYGGGDGRHSGYYQTDEEKQFYQGYNGVTSNEEDFNFDRFSVDMNIRNTFDGMQGSTDLPMKSYDAPTSGVWFGPYFDCQKRYLKTKTTMRMSYSVPITYATDKSPVGFVSIVIGSDLKWWKINPCETSARNMFQGLNRCDMETTTCAEQDIPDFENGYYLSSYKCVCKPNYEFPFIDYGSSYFEGSTVEKEYDKKINGKPNIYDRLKCRPVNIKNQFRQYMNSSNLHKSNNGTYFFAILILLLVNFRTF